MRNSALTPPIHRKAWRDNFHPTAPDPQTPENYCTGPQKITGGSCQPGQTTGSPNTLPYRGKAWGDNFHPTAPDPQTSEMDLTGPTNPTKGPHRTPKIMGGVSSALSDYV